LIAHPVTSAPSLAATAATGTPPGPELIRTAPVIVAAPRRRSTPAAGSASSAAGPVMPTPAASPPSIRSGCLPRLIPARAPDTGPPHSPQRGQTTRRKLTLDTRRQRAG